MIVELQDAARQILQTLQKTWNAGNAAAYAAVFAGDADFITARGERACGRQAIEDGNQAMLDTVYRGSRVAYELIGTRSLGPDVALVASRGTLKVPGGPLAGVHRGVQCLVLIRGQGEWLIASFQNTPEPR